MHQDYTTVHIPTSLLIQLSFSVCLEYFQLHPSIAVLEKKGKASHALEGELFNEFQTQYSYNAYSYKL